LATREGGGGSEWEPIKILLKEIGPCPKIKPTEPTLAQLNRQGYVVIEELLTLGTILGSASGSTINEPKRTGQHQIKLGHLHIEGGSPASHQNQNRSPGIRGRVTRQPTEPKRVTMTSGGGSPTARVTLTKGACRCFRPATYYGEYPK
jgi:hypothetical protein